MAVQRAQQYLLLGRGRERDGAAELPGAGERQLRGVVGRGDRPQRGARRGLVEGVEPLAGLVPSLRLRRGGWRGWRRLAAGRRR